MNYLVIVIIIIALLAAFYTMSEPFDTSSSYASLNFPISLSSPSCVSTKKYTNIYDGYQMPPSDSNPCGNDNNHYKKLSVYYPANEPSYKECNDQHRCRTLGVATGVQGKIL
jgi:hypothetical protein